MSLADVDSLMAFCTLSEFLGLRGAYLRGLRFLETSSMVATEILGADHKKKNPSSLKAWKKC